MCSPLALDHAEDVWTMLTGLIACVLGNAVITPAQWTGLGPKCLSSALELQTWRITSLSYDVHVSREWQRFLQSQVPTVQTTS